MNSKWEEQLTAVSTVTLTDTITLLMNWKSKQIVY